MEFNSSSKMGNTLKIKKVVIAFLGEVFNGNYWRKKTGKWKSCVSPKHRKTRAINQPTMLQQCCYYT
jgi:hypothetical protein